MIWASWNENGDIYYYTADNKKFKTIADATIYLSVTYEELKKQEKYFNTCFERNRKLKVIINKINYPTI